MAVYLHRNLLRFIGSRLETSECCQNDPSSIYNVGLPLCSEGLGMAMNNYKFSSEGDLVFEMLMGNTVLQNWRFSSEFLYPLF